ncbi:hypothetical protein Vretimale_1594 [Volvox reticuliferus]|uniref:Uncharacterized protein n=1 Tax=Volvox reticuliferus TaxID=1737510 RepID=A0A8J4CVB8_9CHLO|nr:hypothetical protein Vretifemale_15566 [Volvox reticuliferus]GIL95607.1 hypothetical protein Vretimale_1594 [Volvox reticuliferus]
MMEPTVVHSALAGALASQYPSMLSLDLRSNNIVSIQDLRPLSRLHDLALDDNRLTVLDGLGELHHLTSLSARSNLITHLGDSVTTLSSLRVLDLAWNHLTAGPWVHLLAKLPQLVELDLRGNPVCDLQGSQQLLAAALPRLQQLNGQRLHADSAPVLQGPKIASAGPHPYADIASRQPIEQQLQQQPQGAEGRATGTLLPGQTPGNHPDVWVGEIGVTETLAPVTAANLGFNGVAARASFYQPTDIARPLNAPANWPHVQLPQSHLSTSSPPRPQQENSQQNPPWSRVSPRGRRLPQDEDLEVEAAVLCSQLETVTQAHEGLLKEQERLVQRSASLESALLQAEAENKHLRQHLQQDSASSAQQVAGLASQVAALLAERDAALRQAELLGSRLSDAERRAAETAQAANQMSQQVTDLQAAKRHLQQELAATQDLLLQRYSAQATAAMGSGLPGSGPAAGETGSGNAATGGQARSPVASSHEQHGGHGLEAAWHQRMDALQQIVRMQERELLRLGALAVGQATEGATRSNATASASVAASSSGWENVLQPWREQVQALQEQLGRLMAEGAEQRAEWSQQLVDMRTQFTHARSLLEVLEQRSRAQRAENAQLQARISQLSAEAQQERQRAAGLEQQVAARDAAAQAVKRQLLAFKEHMEEREAALEARAEQLSAQAERLSHACKRLTFSSSLAALRIWNNNGPSRPWNNGRIAPLGPLLGLQAVPPAAGPSHVVLQGLLAASPAAKLTAASAGQTGVSYTPWTPGRGANLLQAGEDEGQSGISAACPGGSGARPSGGAAHEGSPLVVVLRQELAHMDRDRQMLLQQLAQVSAAAEERIRLAQVAIQERETRQRDALLTARLQAAQQAVEAAAERKIQAAEAAATAQVAEVRHQVQAALTAADELCRRMEATASLRLSKMAVRLQDLVQQVGRLRGERQRVAEELRCSHLDLERLHQEVANRQASEAELRQQLASSEREAHARLAVLKADQEEALAVERRRTAEAERVAAKAVAECGQLERQLARMREVRVQQENARLGRLQSQVHEQERQLRSLRRERNTLLAELRKQLGPARPMWIRDKIENMDTATADDTAEGHEAMEGHPFGAREEGAEHMEPTDADTEPHCGRPASAPMRHPPRREQQLVSTVHAAAISETTTKGSKEVRSSISRLLRSDPQPAGVDTGRDGKPSGERDVAVLQDTLSLPSGAETSRIAVAADRCTVTQPEMVGSARAAPEERSLRILTRGIPLRRLEELEALTTELLSLP